MEEWHLTRTTTERRRFDSCQRYFFPADTVVSHTTYPSRADGHGETYATRTQDMQRTWLPEPPTL